MEVSKLYPGNKPQLVKLASCGRHYSMVLLENNSIMSMGRCSGQVKFDDFQRYSLPNKISNPIEIKYLSAGHSHFMMIDIKSHLWVCGENSHGCLGTHDSQNRSTPTSNSFFEFKRVIDVAAGQNFSVVIAESLIMSAEQEEKIFKENKYDLLNVGIAIAKKEVV
jgi:alpha-tubulin suppressor-like RCC1 family protein